MKKIDRLLIFFGVLLLLVLGYFYAGLWWLPVILGSILVAASFVVSEKSSELVRVGNSNGGTEMILPAVWNEQEIGAGLELYRNNASLLGTYIEGIRSRFLAGQNMQTMESRAKYLETFNRYAEIARESYRWNRYIKGGRAAMEEDHADLEVKIKLQTAKNQLEGLQADPELVELKNRAARLDAELEVARREKELADLRRPDPPPPPPPPTAYELQQLRKSELEFRLRDIKERIRKTEQDSTQNEELKQRELNFLEERLSDVQEELASLL